MRLFRVQWKSHIAGGSDSIVVFASNKIDAFEKGKSMLNTKKLVPSFLNSYGRYIVEEVYA